MDYLQNKKQILRKLLLTVIIAVPTTSVDAAFSFSDFFSTVKTNAEQFIKNNPHAQSILDHTKQQLSEAAQQYGGIAQQYAQQQGQIIVQQAQQQKPQSFGAAKNFLGNSVSTFGTGLWEQIQATNTGQQNTLPQTQQISMAYGQLSSAISMHSNALKIFQLPAGTNGANVPVWLNELQNLSSIVSSIGNDMQAGTIKPYAAALSILIGFTEQHNKMVYLLANQQAGHTILPGNSNWDYFVNMNGQKFDRNGNYLNTTNAGYSSQNIAAIEAKRSQMAALIVSLLNLVIRNGSILAQIDEKLPNEVLSVITTIAEMSPTDANANTYISVAQNQQKAIPYIISQQGFMKPADQTWSTLQDTNGNIYNLQGQYLRSGDSQTVKSINNFATPSSYGSGASSILPNANSFGTAPLNPMTTNPFALPSSTTTSTVLEKNPFM